MKEESEVSRPCVIDCVVYVDGVHLGTDLYLLFIVFFSCFNHNFFLLSAGPHFIRIKSKISKVVLSREKTKKYQRR